MKRNFLIFNLIVLAVLLVLKTGNSFASDTTCDEWVSKAEGYMETNPQKAEALFVKALRKCPDTKTLYLLARALAAQEKNAKAVKVLEQVVTLEPDNKEALKLLARLLIKARIDLKKGKSIARKVLKDNPNDKEAKDILATGIAEELRQKGPEPLDRVLASKTHDCLNALWYATLGNNYLIREPFKAEALYREALRHCPQSVNLLYNLSLALYQQGRFKQAVEVLKRVMDKEPEDTSLQRLYAYMLVDGNIDINKGRSIAKDLLEKDPSDSIAKSIVVLAVTKALPIDISLEEEPEKGTKEPSTHGAKALYDVDADVPRLGIVNKDAVAVVIGNKNYRHRDIPPVEYAINDAMAVKRYLINVLGYREGNIIYVTDASKAQFESIFGTAADYRGKLYNYLRRGRSDIFIYYSGHGAPDLKTRTGYFVPVDADPEAIALTGYPLKLLYDNVAKISRAMKVPNVFIVIDACFSGATEKGMILKNVSPVSIKVKNPLVRLKNAVVITSAKGTEVSSWYPEQGHSLFTYFFLKALRDEVKRKKKVITAWDIYRQVADRSNGVPYWARRLYGRSQSPMIMGDKNRPILKLTKR